MENKEIEININFFGEEGIYLFGKSNNNKKYYIAREIDDVHPDLVLPQKFIKYYNLLPINDKKYELLEIEGHFDFDFASTFLMSIAKLDRDLISSMSMIEEIFKSCISNIDLKQVKSVFAELSAIKKFSLKLNDDEFSIYDFMSDDEMIDVEIKSFSKTKRDIQVSYQQLTNSKNAFYYLMEVEESLEGENIITLIDELGLSSTKRYGFYKESQSKHINKKFKNIEIIETSNEVLSEGLNLPKLAKDAHFKFNVDFLKDK